MRASGILLHITSLPSTYGVGSLGDVDKFIKFLTRAGQTYWQILPISPTDFANSPYSSTSTYAANPLLIDLDELVSLGLLSQNDILPIKHARGCDFEYAKQNKQKMLRIASKNFYKQNPTIDYLDFCDDQQHWLNDFCLFSALKTHFNGVCWREFPDINIALHKPDAVAYYSEKLSDEIDFERFCQYTFFRQWGNFRQKLAQSNIKLVGDIPFYVAFDSADVWANRSLFELQQNLNPRLVAGVPPDYFSKDGQLWGNPLFNFKAMKADGFKWWLDRIAYNASLFDVLRIDHFRAFDSYFAIKFGQPTARKGSWKKGVGNVLLKNLQTTYPELNIVAEDLGDIPESVYKLRDKFGICGMKVMHFAFDGNPNNSFLPHMHPQDCIAYLGTHDNDTTIGWWQSLQPYTKQQVLDYCKTDNDSDINFKLMEVLSQSKAKLVIFCMQDIASLPSAFRMNTPGTTGCWQYMAENGDFSNANAKKLYSITEKYNRLNQNNKNDTPANDFEGDAND